MTMNIQITGNVSTEEQMAYVNYLESKYNRKLKSLSINADGEFADLNYEFEPVPFDRIRRITGYLVGTMDKWNNAKYAEEHDRVKHDIGTSLEQL
jgi:hypothetical protein